MIVLNIISIFIYIIVFFIYIITIINIFGANTFAQHKVISILEFIAVTVIIIYLFVN